MKVRNPVAAWIAGGIGFGLIAGGILPPISCADMLLGNNGWVGQAKDAPPVSPDDDPPDEVLAGSSGTRIDASYDVVKVGGQSIPAGQVRKIFSDESVTNEEFRKANSAGEAKLFKEAGDGFSAAAETLTGMGKQDALWNAVRAYQEAGLPDETNGAIDALLAAFPKSFYFAPAQMVRARVMLAKGDLEGAKKAFSAVGAEKGMNPRDSYRAEYMRIFLTEEAQRQAEAARGNYQKLIDTIQRGDPVLGAAASQLATVGLANTLLTAKKPSEALVLYNRATESRDADVLAAAYAGLGDISFGEAKGLRDEKKLPEAKAKLEEAVLHYLRVTVLYRPDAEEAAPILRSLSNQASVFKVLFEMSGQKDLDALDKACNSYYQLYQALDDGNPEKRAAVRTYNELVKIRKELAEKPK
jgi:hypothetical protein